MIPVLHSQAVGEMRYREDEGRAGRRRSDDLGRTVRVGLLEWIDGSLDWGLARVNWVRCSVTWIPAPAQACRAPGI